ncbi:MAG: VCBS repeat-containing protein [Bacteroidaceae bacterium]|nr:VCBS repeat-containing protein [Bacteroidaceae bacterium]
MKKLLVLCCLLSPCALLNAEDANSEMMSSTLFWGENKVETFEEWLKENWGISSKEDYLETVLGSVYASVEEMVQNKLKKDIGYTTKEDYLQGNLGYATKKEFVENDGDPYEWEEMETEWENLYADMYEVCSIEYNKALLFWDDLQYRYESYIDIMYASKGQFAKSIMDFYDVDGDKILEWKNNLSIYKINLEDHIAYEYAKYPQNINEGTWTNLNNDGLIDIHGSKYTFIGIPAGYKEVNSLTSSIENNFSRQMCFDYDNDGFPNILNSSSRREISTIYDNEEPLMTSVWIKTPDERDQIIEYRNNSGIVSQSASVALSFNNVVSSTTSSETIYPHLSSYNIDVNGDGIEDYIDCSQGVYIQGMGDGNGIYNDLGGAVQVVDLDNDGNTELIAWDNKSQSILAYFLQKNGIIESKKIFSGAIGNILASHDFDKDGDIDILLTFDYCTKIDYGNDPGGSFLVLVENLGNRKFKNHEYFYPNYLHFFYAVDFDSDGNYEVLAVEDKRKQDSNGITEDKLPYLFLEIEKTKVSETPIYLNSDIKTEKKTSTGNCANVMMADLDNSGIMTLISQEGSRWVATSLSSVVNEKPKKPEPPFWTYDSSTENLKINWLPTTDKESSSADLTYALRIGTLPGACDILYVHAHEDGTRKNMRGGNQGHSLFRMLNTQTWTEGKYYISVQAVDPNNRGSEFSDEVIFEKKSPVATFSINCPSPFGVGDTCIVVLHPNVNVSKINWNLDDAIIVQKNADERTLKLVFDQHGEKTISLNTVGVNGEIFKSFSQSISVQSFKTSVLFSSGKSSFALDMDEDGCMEYYFRVGNYDDNRTFYTYSADGSSSTINKLFTRNSYVQKIGISAHTFDVNNDGMCDIFARYDEFGNTGFFSIVNESDKNMSINTDLVSVGDTEPKFIDFDNDGWMDCFYKDVYSFELKLKKNSGNYASFEETSHNIDKKADIWNFRDYTNDGLVDILMKHFDYTSRNYSFIVYENQGDFTFQPTDTVLTCPEVSFKIIEDFNNDENLDVLYSEYGKYYIYWNDGTIQFLEEVTEVDLDLFDYNNDGFIDIQVRQGKFNNEWGALMFNADCSYQIADFVGKHVSENISTTEPYLLPNGEVAFERYKLYNVNTSPTAPTNLAAGRTSKGVILTWNHGNDRETPQTRLRYNLSVKRKGQSGEGAYLISPCNSTKNGVHVPSNKPLIHGNKFVIPIASIPVGEYEVQVQTIDLQMQESEFSEVLNLIVTENVNIESPATTAVGVKTEITIASNVEATINWDGGIVTSQEGNIYTLEWSSEGYKTIVVGDSKQTIYVHPRPKLEWNLPTHILLGAKIKVNVKELANSKKIYIGDSPTNLIPIEKSQYANIDVLNDSTIQFVFNKEGIYNLLYNLTTPYDNYVSVCEEVEVEKDATPKILGVTANSGHYQLTWNVPLEFSSQYEIIGVNVYKETNKSNEYKLLKQIKANDGVYLESGEYSYIDISSNPNVQSARYSLSYLLANGESAMGTPHQGMHVMINRGVGTSWNLAWTKYEGCEVQTYRILRGTSAENLEVIDEVSGNMSSYSDINPITGTLYYAVEIVQSSTKEQSTRSIDSEITSRSNVVSTEVAGTVVFVKSLELNGGTIIASEKNYLDLFAYVYPNNATYQGINWVVMSGDELATVDRYGRLRATGKGDGEVIVRAYALDGSGIYAETMVKIDGFVVANVEDVLQGQDSIVRVTQYGNLLNIFAPVETPIAVYNISGTLLYSDMMRENSLQYRLVEKGIYLLRVGNYVYKFVYF